MFKKVKSTSFRKNSGAKVWEKVYARSYGRSTFSSLPFPLYKGSNYVSEKCFLFSTSGPSLGFVLAVTKKLHGCRALARISVLLIIICVFA